MECKEVNESDSFFCWFSVSGKLYTKKSELIIESFISLSLSKFHKDEERSYIIAFLLSVSGIQICHCNVQVYNEDD